MSIKKALTFFGWPLLFAPIISGNFGESLNAIVTIANGGVMPVRHPSCLTDPTAMVDGPHVCMTAASHIKFLADIITSNDGIRSLGDQFITLSGDIKIPCFILWLTIFLFCLIRKEKFYTE